MKKVVFYRTDAGKDVVVDEIRKLSDEDRKKVGEDLRFVQIGYPVGPPQCRPLRDGLWEVRSSLPSGPKYRLICTYDSATETVVVLNGFVKKTQRTPASEIELAKERRRKLEKRE